ncbi:MAG: DUF3822 family protein [Bacteroidetes bacterium]|nr:DUF3822 family protein [Bacteroidota bacterium]
MQVEGIISNPITQDIRLKGHQTIRFSADGFSILVSDASYKPVFLKQYVYDPSVPASIFPAECGRILDEIQLLDFEGETVIILDSLSATIVPEQLFHESDSRILLTKAAEVDESALVSHRYIGDRDLNILYTLTAEMDDLKGKINGPVQIIHTSECLLSLSDQVQASDHQRGFILAEVQNQTLEILVIQEDRVRLLNRYALKDPSDFIYHTLNTLKQLELDRETIPVYLSGIVHPEHELFGLLGKYIRQVKTTPYYLEELSRAQMLHYMILSEGSKCV